MIFGVRQRDQVISVLGYQQPYTVIYKRQRLLINQRDTMSWCSLSLSYSDDRQQVIIIYQINTGDQQNQREERLGCRGTGT